MRILASIMIAALTTLVGCASAPQAVEPEAPTAEAASGDTPQEAVDEVGPIANTLRWTTASEVDNFGFDIFRGESEEGPFTRMTEQPLLGAGTIDEPQSYVWVDESIEPDTPYFYYIESISMSGDREQFSPIIKAPGKKRE